jgi:hypothetical protein
MGIQCHIEGLADHFKITLGLVALGGTEQLLVRFQNILFLFLRIYQWHRF